MTIEDASFANENINPNLGSNISRNVVRRTYDTYYLHVDVQSEYEPLQKRNKPYFLTNEEKELRRNNGERHLDLWTDGSMYPKDPITNAPPPFSNITNLLHFTGDGRHGLLGYTKHLEMKAVFAEHQRDFLYKENIEIKNLNGLYAQKLMTNKETFQDLEKKIDDLRTKDTSLGLRKRKRRLCNIEKMKLGSGGMKKRVNAVR